MRTSLKSAALLGALAILSTGAANATVISGTVSGTLWSAQDTYGYFGGGDLAGQSVTATITYDTTLLNEHSTASQNWFDGSSGGGLTLSVTIGGTTYAASSTSGYSLLIKAVNSASNQQLVAYAYDVSTFVELGFTIPQPFAQTPDALDSQVAFQAMLGNLQAGYAQSIYVGDGSNIETFYLTPTAQPQNPVPEPASLGLLGAGLAGLGWLRRRARQA